MQAQIKSLGEFVQRFNYEKDPNGVAIPDSVKKAVPRAQYLNRLFNEDDARLKPAKPGVASLYRSKADLFIEMATDEKKPIRLSRQPALYAEVDYRVWHGQKKDTLTVYLKKFYRADSAAYWQVVGVQKPRRLSLPESKTSLKKDTSRHEQLPPNAQDVSFLPLLKGIIATKSLLTFAPDTLQPDATWRVVEAALQQGKLTVETALQTTVYVDTRNGWVVQLGEFIREKENSGWLITNLYDPPLQATLPTVIRRYLSVSSK